MNATEFEGAQQIGAVVYKRLRQEIRGERILLLGSAPDLPLYEEVWTGLLKTALADQIKIDVFFQREGLRPPEPTGAWNQVIFNQEMIQSGQFVRAVTEHMQAGHLVLIHSLSEEVSHLSKDSLSRQLDLAAHHPVLAISTLALSLSPGEENILQTRCLESMEATGGARLGCAEARVAKTLSKKKLTPGKLWAVMERHGLKEYLIFIHR